jgi:Tol biopolymer transport system component
MSAQDTWDFRGANVTDGNTRLMSFDVASRESTEIQAGGGVKYDPTVLHNGEIAFVRKDRANAGIFYTDGRRGPSGEVRSPSWSSDGQRVVYYKIRRGSASDWEKASSRDPKYELIMTRGQSAFDPSGKYLLTTPGVFSGNNSILLIESGKNRSRPIFTATNGRAVTGAHWSLRGNRIAFGLGGFFFEGRSRGSQIATISSDGSDFRQHTSDTNNNGFPSFSPDGKQIVYRTFGPEGQGLRIIDLENNSIRTLTTAYDNFPLWSPRGDLILFTRLHEGDYEIFTIQPDGKNLKRLTNVRGNEGHCGWSPDGEWIAFTSSRPGWKDEAVYTDAPQPYGELFVMRYNGKDVHQLTDNQWEDGAPAWQPHSTVQRTRSQSDRN